MRIKKILCAIITVIVLVFLAGFLLVRTWTGTPHGRLDPRVAIYLRLTGAGGAGDRPLPIAESRKRLEKTAALVSGEPAPMAWVKDMTASAGGLSVPVRVYWPVKGGPSPAVVFYHGGGWVQGSLDTHDGLCRVLAKKTGAVVVAVDYRLAPEHVFPAAVDDAYAVLLWVREKGKGINVDANRIAVAGDSAGGNLAAAVCLMARDRKGPAVAFQALIYPGVNVARLDTDSYRMFARGYKLNKSDVERFIDMYLPDKKDRTGPYASPLLAKNHRDLPPALIVTAAFDVLRDEGDAYAKKLNESGVTARAVRFPGMIHAFVSADRLLPQADLATDMIAAAIKEAFGM